MTSLLELLLLDQMIREERVRQLIQDIPVADRFWHCTNHSDCPYDGMSHSAAYCGKDQPRICGCHWDQQRLKEEMR